MVNYVYTKIPQVSTECIYIRFQFFHPLHKVQRVRASFILATYDYDIHIHMSISLQAQMGAAAVEEAIVTFLNLFGKEQMSHAILNESSGSGIRHVLKRLRSIHSRSCQSCKCYAIPNDRMSCQLVERVDFLTLT